MIKNFNDITIMGNLSSPMIRNGKNNARYSFDEKGRVHYTDPFGNDMQNCYAEIQINFVQYSLNAENPVIDLGNKTISLLYAEDIQELAHKTFYEQDQEPIFNFLTHTFLIDLDEV